MNRKKKERKVMKRLLKALRFHYDQSQANSDMTCGGALGDHIRGNKTQWHMEACAAVGKRLDRLENRIDADLLP